MSRHAWRPIVLALVLATAVASLFGCAAKSAPAPAASPASSAPAPAPAAKKDPVKLKVWLFDRVGKPAVAEAHQAIEAWAKETGNTVEISDHEFFELTNKIPVAFPAGDGPDVTMITNNLLGQNYTAGLIAPIDDALPATEKAKYVPSAINSFTVDGHLLGVPIAADVNALLYNKALLPEPPKTMDEMIVKAKSMTAGDHYGLLYTIDQFWFSYPFFSGYGGYVFKWTGNNWDPKDLGFANPGAIQGLSFTAGLVDSFKLMPADVTWDVMNSLFSSGKAAMIINNPTMIPSYQKAGIDVGVARLPQLDNGKYPHPFATFTGFAVNAYSKHKPEAAVLAAYLGSHLPVPLYKSTPGNIPVYKDALNSPDLAKDPALAAWMSQLEESDPLPSINEMNLVWQSAGTAFQTVVHGKAKPEEALKAAQQQIQEAIDKASKK